MLQKCNQAYFKTIGSALGTAIALAMSGGGSAAPQDGWSIQIEPMYMGVFGNDENVASLFRSEGAFGPGPIRDSTKTEELDFDEDFALRGEFQFLRNQWGIGVSAFWFDTDGDTSSTADTGTSDGIQVDTFLSFLFTTFPDGRLTLRTDSDLEVWSTDLYGIRTLAEKPDSHINMLFGLKLGDLENKTKNKLAEGRVIGGTFNTGSTGREDYDTDTDTLFGPLIGITGEARYGKHRFKGLFTQAFLFGDVDRKYRFNFDNNADGTIDEISTFDSDENIVIPVSELRIKYLYDLTDNVSLGIGTYVSAWWDAPVNPGVDTKAKNENNLVFLGGMATLDWRF